MTEKQKEGGRIAALKGYGVLDSPNEEEFDAIVRETARALRTPIALISLVDENRQWFKAKVGLQASETPRSISFCTHAIRGPDIFVVEDATKDERFSDNPLVIGDPSIRFYAGIPLKTDSGQRIGTLCVLDHKPHQALDEADAEKLAAFAEQTMAALARRAERRRP
jgi:GAF domain-containing protein